MDVVIWKGVFDKIDVPLKDGLEVLVTGSFSVYVNRGSMSFHVDHLEVAGEGLLRQQVARLAKKLEAEGLMDPQRKRKVPVFCTRVGVVTSLSGSVIEDVKRTLARRNPLVELVCAGCAVQGPQAPASIVDALNRMATQPVDAILLVRGGGSFEDLMCFNDESVARAIAACPIPVVTGIGHEPDTTIADNVSDRRCSTPTHAAESIAPSLEEIIQVTDARESRLVSSVLGMLQFRSSELDSTGESLVKACDRVVKTHASQVTSLAAHRCLVSPDGFLRDRADQVELTATRLLDAGPRAIARIGRDVEVQATGLLCAGGRICSHKQLEIARLASTLDALSPLKVLGRGYAIPRTPSGTVVHSVGDVATGDELEVLVVDGTISATVNKSVAQTRE